MALTPRPHGITPEEVAARNVYLAIVATSIWGVVCTSTDADPDVFPLNTVVSMTDPESFIADAGLEGTLSLTLQAIAAFGPSTGVVVRVAEGVGATPAEITASRDVNVIAGIAKLRVAEQAVQLRPRILAAPGLDTQPVADALGDAGARLSAIAYATAEGDTPAEVKTYRDNFTQRELILIDRTFKATDAVSALIVSTFAPAVAVGVRAYLDRTVGYHKTISNVVLEGVVGIENPREWDLGSAQTEMGLINGADVTGLIWRDGYRFWGNRTCSVDPRYAFESAVRTNQLVRDTIVEGLFPYIDQPLIGSLPNDIVESINKLFRREVSAGRLVGAIAFIAPGNTKETLAAGKLKIGYRFTHAAPLEELSVANEITDEFYADFAVAA
ncbi:tail sheath protein [Brevundimonas intermedia]|uniref:Tail sheath protein n=1 Tax=Brevundimonas intermedia TaxID=74315 RepID=A0ABQ5TB27_9CAUL|nr:phage tail sheath subtilisin-like domain-containing protein [Brevundimonas intermedia]GLK49607.1 tail sheath protein [Brevundimonas intermedia]